jgi:hypothetical protein
MCMVLASMLGNLMLGYIILVGILQYRTLCG